MSGMSTITYTVKCNHIHASRKVVGQKMHQIAQNGFSEALGV